MKRYVITYSYYVMTGEVTGHEQKLFATEVVYAGDAEQALREIRHDGERVCVVVQNMYAEEVLEKVGYCSCSSPLCRVIKDVMTCERCGKEYK